MAGTPRTPRVPPPAGGRFVTVQPKMGMGPRTGGSVVQPMLYVIMTGDTEWLQTCKARKQKSDPVGYRDVDASSGFENLGEDEVAYVYSHGSPTHFGGKTPKQLVTHLIDDMLLPPHVRVLDLQGCNSELFRPAFEDLLHARSGYEHVKVIGNVGFSHTRDDGQMYTFSKENGQTFSVLMEQATSAHASAQSSDDWFEEMGVMSASEKRVEAAARDQRHKETIDGLYRLGVPRARATIEMANPKPKPKPSLWDMDVGPVDASAWGDDIDFDDLLVAPPVLPPTPATPYVGPAVAPPSSQVSSRYVNTYGPAYYHS